jgi:hypothetical protein
MTTEIYVNVKQIVYVEESEVGVCLVMSNDDQLLVTGTIIEVLAALEEAATNHVDYLCHFTRRFDYLNSFGVDGPNFVPEDDGGMEGTLE